MVRNIGNVGDDVVVIGNVSRVKVFHNDFGEGVNICISDVKVQSGDKIIGHEDHIWVNNYSQRGNQKVSELKNVQVGDRVGVKGQVRSYNRIDGSQDYDIKNVVAVRVF